MKININGVIVSNDDKWIYEYFGIEAVCPKDVTDKINQANGEPLEIEINSGGGDVFAGSEIYTVIKDYKGSVTIKITGLAASAASVIAMAAQKVLISPTAQIMIHNVSVCGAYGDYRDMEHNAEMLKNYNVSISNAYQLKTGMKQEELLELMNKETWLNAQKSLELKFVDEIMFDEGKKLSASLKNHPGLLPSEVVNKVRQSIKQKSNIDEKSKAEGKLKLLKMRGVI